MKKREVENSKDYETVIDAFLAGFGVDEMPFTQESVEGVLRETLRELREAKDNNLPLPLPGDFEDEK